MQRHYSPLWLWALLLVPLWPAAARAVDTVDVEPTRGGNLTIRPLTHAAVLLQWRGKVVYVDPVGNQDWGKLPKQMAEQLTQGQREGIAGEYRNQVETYYRAIAEKSKKQ